MVVGQLRGIPALSLADEDDAGRGLAERQSGGALERRPQLALQRRGQLARLPVGLCPADVLEVHEELDEVGQLVEPGARHGVPRGRTVTDPVDEGGVVALRHPVLLALEATGEERDDGADGEVGPALPDDEVRRQVAGVPPLAQGRRVGPEPVELVAELEAFGRRFPMVMSATAACASTSSARGCTS